jgi:hypothetical protein
MPPMILDVFPSLELGKFQLLLENEIVGDFRGS